MALVALLVLSMLCEATAQRFDSVIKPGVRTVYWRVTDDQCTAVHGLNITNGALSWRRSPVDEEQSWAAVTERRAFYTLSTGPQVTAVSIDTGNARYSWPPRVGHIWWRRWDIDIPQSTQLSTPVPALQAQLLLLRAQEQSKVYALNLSTGNLTWEYDALEDVSKAAVAAGLGKPRDLMVTGWELEGPDSVFVALTANHPAAPTAPFTTHSVQSAARTQAAQGDTHRAGVGSWWPDSLSPRRWWPHGWWPFNHGDGADSGVDDADVEPRGWVVALNITEGRCAWVSGPLELRVSRLVLSEPTVLVVSEPGEDGAGWLYGLDKNSGALLYALSCSHGPCSVDVSDTRIALLTTGLRQHPPQLTELAAFELDTGAWLWRGMPTSTYASHLVGDCSAVAAPRTHVYFACTCAASALAVQSSPEAADQHTGSADTQTDSAYQVTSESSQSQHTGSQVQASKKPRPKPAPKPPPPPPAGLCAFAIAADTGKLGFEVVLSHSDAVPVNASDYGFAPLVIAEVVVFRGRRGVYAMPQLNSVHLVSGTAQPAQETATPGSAISAQQAQGEAEPQHGMRQLQQSSAPLRLQYSFQLPPGQELQSWDWLDLKAGKLMLQASVPLPPDDDDSSNQHRSRLWPRSHPHRSHWTRVGDTGGGLPPMSSWIYALDSQNGSLLWSLATNMTLGPMTAHTVPHDWARGGLLLVDGCRPALDDLPPVAASSGSRRRRLLSQIQAVAGSAANAGVTGSVDSTGGTGGVGSQQGRQMLASYGRAHLGSVSRQRHPVITGTVSEADSGDSGGTGGSSGEGTGGDENKGVPPKEDLGDGMSCCLYAVSADTGVVAWQHCYDMDKACSSGLARHTATNIVYMLLAAQVFVLVGGCIMGVVCMRRARASRVVVATIMHDPDSEEETLLVTVPPAPGISHWQRTGDDSD